MTGWIFRRLRTLTHQGRVDEEIRRELEFHLAMEAEERERRGLSPDEARRTTKRDFGSVAATREAIRDTRGITFFDTLRQDVRFGVRTLKRWPGYTAATVATLALGIGINTAIFSVVNDVLLRPLPYRDGDRLVRIVQSLERPSRVEAPLSIPELADYRAMTTSLDNIVEYHSMNFVLLDQGEPDRVRTGVVSADYFDAFGVKPILGRAFRDADDEPGAAPVLLLSHEYWQRKFHGNPGVVGQAVQMNDRPHTVVGVLPPIPQYPVQNDVYMPTLACPFRAMGEAGKDTNRRAFGALNVFARLKPGASVEEASRDVARVGQMFAEQHSAVYRPDLYQFGSGVTRLNDELVRNARQILLALLGTTTLVLLIACANVANLSLSRMAQRDREVALRVALGAGRGRLVRQLLTESILVAVAGGSLGLAVAWGSLGLLVPFAARYTSRVLNPSIDGTVLAFTMAISLATGLLFGILPALAARGSLSSSLKDGGQHASDGVKPRRLRSALVVAEVAVCFALLIGAGLFIDSLRRLSAVDLGFRADRVLTAEVFGNWSTHPSPHDRIGLYATILDRLRRTKGVHSAAITNGVPLTNMLPGDQPIEIEGVTPPDLALLPLADNRVASEGYFETLGLYPLAGRLLEARDNEEVAPVAVINESMAKLWAGADPIGRRFRIHEGSRDFTVIGIVPDFRQFSMDRAAGAQFYTPFRQTPGIGARVLLRTEGDPLDYVDALKAAVYAADPQMPVSGIDTLESLRLDRLASPGLNAALLSVFATLALLITVAGIAAVVGTYVSQRTREFGVRMALGATRSSLVGMVLRQGMWLVAIGLVGGAAGGILVGRGVRAFLYETTPTDPLVYVVTACIFVVASLVACVGPARRATGVDPLLALKTD